MAGGGYGFPVLTTAAAELEAAIVAGASAVSIERYLATLTVLCARASSWPRCAATAGRSAC